MEFLNQIMPSLLSLVGTVVAVLLGYAGVEIKKLYNKYVDTQVEKDVVNTTVKYVEQVFTDIHGKEKLDEALSQASKVLQEKGIQVSTEQLTTLIESAVYGLNKGLESTEEQSVENSTIAVSDIAYLLGFIVSVWGVVKIFKEVVTPYRIKMKEIEKNTEYLRRDDKRIKYLEDSHAMIYECLLVMLNHEITGNGVDKMKQVRDEMQEFIINKNKD